MFGPGARTTPSSPFLATLLRSRSILVTDVPVAITIPARIRYMWLLILGVRLPRRGLQRSGRLQDSQAVDIRERPRVRDQGRPGGEGPGVRGHPELSRRGCDRPRPGS